MRCCACFRHLAIAFGAAVACSSSVDAFEFSIHVAITRDGLARIVDALTRALPDQRIQENLAKAAGAGLSTFSTKALQEITDANKAQDTSDCKDKRNISIPAQPCSVLGLGVSEDAYAFVHLWNEPPWEHFDAERIQDSSDFVRIMRGNILFLLKQGQFIGARKQLGHALHAIQDFYSHTNYVELGFTEIDRRIGQQENSFSVPGTRPRLAASDEPTCLLGEYLFTNDLKNKLTKDLIATPTSEVQKIREISAAIVFLEELIDDPDARGLTSGYFSLSPTAVQSPEIQGLGKCLHGYKKGIANQPGIHKDGVGRERHGDARRLAVAHTTDFVVGIVRSILADPAVENDEKLLLVAGLLGYEPRMIITGMSVGVPGAPKGDSWDSALSSAVGLFVGGIQGLKNILPDIRVCMESPSVPQICAPVCENADWMDNLNGYGCVQPINPYGWGPLAEPDLRVLVYEMGTPQRVIAHFRIEDPRGCDPFCALDLETEPKRTIWMRFDFKAVEQYGGVRRPRAILPPIASNLIAKPAGPTGGASAPSPPATGTSTTTSTTAAPAPAALPGARTAAASPAAAPPPAAVPPAAAPGTAARVAAIPPPPARTAEGIDSRLTALRDADNCVSPDAFYPSTPPASLAGAQAAQLYQLAAFSMAIADPTAKQAVLNAVRAKVGDDAFFTAMTSVIGDPVQSQRLSTAYQSTAQNVVQQITSNGLASLLPVAKPPSALLPDVDRWILSRLSSPALASTAVDLMSSERPLTAECTLNELARQGFTAAVVP